jgi:hypothetical protein
MNIKTAAKSSLPALLPKYPSPNESNQPNLNCFNRQDRATRLRTTVDGTLAVQRDGRSHKPSVRLRAHWGCHGLTALNPPEVLLQPGTAADGQA